MFYKILSNTKTYLAAAIILSAAAALTVGFYTYHGARAVEERALIERTEIVALSLDARELTFLAGNESDLQNPFFQSLKRRLRKVKEVNEDVSYIYLAGRRPTRETSSSNGAGEYTLFFYVDAGAIGSDESPPGQTYEEASDVFKDTFVTALPRFEGPLRDRWGNWISAFVPITDPKSGEIIAVLGMDVSALEYRKRVALSMAAPIFLIAMLFSLFLAEYMRYKKGREILAHKAEFLSIASHDLRAPLIGVLWALQALTLDKQLKIDPRVRETADKIELTLKRALESVQGILDSSRWDRSLEENRAVATDAAKVVREVIETLDLAAREREVTVVLAKDFPKTFPVKAPVDRLRHVFSNVISNAIKYSRAGSTVRVKFSKENTAAVVRVEDHGLGIPERDRKKIFSEYFRGSNTAPDQRGTGLGLYFTKRLVEEFGGRIRFVSEENKGTKFYIEIPFHDKKT